MKDETADSISSSLTLPKLYLAKLICKSELHSVSARLRHCGNPALHSETGPQENGERANLALYFYKAACRLNPGILYIAIPRLTVATSIVTNELTIYNATNISFLATKKYSSLVAIIATSFLYVEDR